MWLNPGRLSVNSQECGVPQPHSGVITLSIVAHWDGVHHPESDSLGSNDGYAVTSYDSYSVTQFLHLKIGLITVPTSRWVHGLSNIA